MSYSNSNLARGSDRETRKESEITADWNSEHISPVVSIICHTYNHKDYLASALESFLMQRTKYPFEILLHDDASTDGTQAIASYFSKRFPSIIVPIFQKYNQYSQGNWPHKFTFKTARGRFIALCEGDDYWVDAEKLDKQIRAMNSSPSVNISFHPTRVETTSGEILRILGDYGGDSKLIGVERVLDETGAFSGTASLMFRTEAALALPNWFFEDINRPVGDFFIETIVGRFGLLYVPGTMAAYRLGVPGSYTAISSARTVLQLREDLDRLVRYIRKLSEYPEIRADAIETHVGLVKKAYARQFWARGSFVEFKYAMNGALADTNIVTRFCYWSAVRSKFAFVAIIGLNRVIRVLANLLRAPAEQSNV